MNNFNGGASTPDHGKQIKNAVMACLLLAALYVVVAFVSRDKAEFLVALGVAMLAGYALFRSPDMATLVFLFVLYTNLAVIAIQFHGVPQIVGAGVSLLLALPFANYIILQRERMIFDQTFVLLLIYLAALVASSILAINMKFAIEGIVNFVTEGLILYFLVVNVVRTLPALRRAMWVVLLACGFLGSLSLLQELTGNYENSFGGLAQRIADVDSGDVDFEEFSGSRRAYGPLGSQNRYAQILVVILPFSLCFSFTEQSPRAKLLAVGAGLLAFGGLILTFSRGAFVTIAGMVFIVMVLGYIKPHKLIPAAIAGFVLLGLMMPEYVARVSTVGAVGSLLSNNTEGSREADGSLRGRYAESMAAFNVFFEHPIVGVGPGQFFRYYSQKYGNDIGTKRLAKGRRAHNLYLEIAADTGALGIGTFLAIVFILIKRHWKLFRELRQRRPELAHYAAAFVVGLCGYLGSGMFLHLSYQRYYWLLIALAGAAYRIIRIESMTEATDDEQAEEPLAQRQIVYN